MDELKKIAHIETDFETKFGVPRQSGLVKGLKGRIVFEPEYRNVEAFRGLEGFSHIWLLWDFSLIDKKDEKWSPTVRPPRLGGNQRMGVWATRSPFRPNHIGLSSVRLTRINLHTPIGPILEVEGADLVNGTPIYDIKPYLPFTDCHPDATGGFAQEQNECTKPLNVKIPESLSKEINNDVLEVLKNILAADPRPHYHQDEERIYSLVFAKREFKFRIRGECVEILA